MNSWQWRPYQVECFEKVIAGFRQGINSQLCVLATGTGKRSLAVWLAGKTGRSLFLAHNEELIEQAYEDFSRSYGFMNVGIVKGPRMEIDKRFVIASPQTLYNRLSKISPDTFNLVQVDETHRYMAKTFYGSVNHFNAKRIGWTATPRRLDGLSLMDLFQEKIFEYNIVDGIRDGYLSELDGIRVKTEISLDGISKKFGDFNEAQLGNVVNCPERNNLIVQSYLKYARDRQFIAFCVNTQHAQDLAEHFRDVGIPVGVVSSNQEICNDRKGIIADLKNKKLRGLINVNILVEGFDYHDVGAVLMARPTQSEVIYFQAIGRGTRLKSEDFISRFGAKNCVILDFVDNTSRHKLVNSFELDKGLKAKDKMFVTTEKRDKLLEKEKEREMGRGRIDTVVRHDERINLMELPVPKLWESVKANDPATEKQIAMLQKIGIWSDTDPDGEPVVYTKLMASELIMNAPAEAWQCVKLLNWGYDPKDATMGQFYAVKAKMDAKKEASKENKYLPKQISNLRVQNYHHQSNLKF